MLIRKLAIAGFVLAAMGLTITVTTVVIGQQPGIAKTETAPAAGATRSAADGFSGTAPPAAELADEGAAAAPAGAGAGGGVPAPPTEAGAGGGVEAPPADSGSASETTPGKTKGRSKSSAKTPRSGVGMIGPGGMPGMPGGKADMQGMPGTGVPGGGWMPGMEFPGKPVSEDEHLETWVNRALAAYAQTDDQNARKQQRDEISKALDRIFDIRQERRMAELETLELRVQKLRGTLETREKLKTDILKNRLDYLIREADGLGWGDGLPAPGRSAPTGFGSGGSSSSGFNPLKNPATGGPGGPPPAGSR